MIYVMSVEYILQHIRLLLILNSIIFRRTCVTWFAAIMALLLYPNEVVILLIKFVRFSTHSS